MIHLTIPKIDGGGYERVAAWNTQWMVPPGLAVTVVPARARVAEGGSVTFTCRVKDDPDTGQAHGHDEADPGELEVIM